MIIPKKIPCKLFFYFLYYLLKIYRSYNTKNSDIIQYEILAEEIKTHFIFNNPKKNFLIQYIRH
jgi:hypothetical protein